MFVDAKMIEFKCVLVEFDKNWDHLCLGGATYKVCSYGELVLSIRLFTNLSITKQEEIVYTYFVLYRGFVDFFQEMRTPDRGVVQYYKILLMFGTVHMCFLKNMYLRHVTMFFGIKG